MPQISQILATYASQFFWLLIVFGLIYFVIGRGILPRVDATVDARDAKIAGDLAAAAFHFSTGFVGVFNFDRHVAETRTHVVRSGIPVVRQLQRRGT